MKVLIIGSGGREHVMAWKVSQSQHLTKLYIAPGNAGTASLGENVPIKATDIGALKDFVKSQSIDLTIVGPEQPLVDGIVDAFQNDDLVIFGPRQNAAQLEGSKAFSKDFMRKYRIPTAEFETFTVQKNAIEYVDKIGAPVVVKASGLAAGKGVILCDSVEEAHGAIEKIMGKQQFGEAGEEVVIEELLNGEELSLIAVCDGKNYKLLVPSQDHKAAYVGDKGPNTGGMGAYAPAPVATEPVIDVVRRKVIEPTIAGMAAEGMPYVGFLYCGLMITGSGPKVLEFNCRLGDPEAQVILPLLQSDFLEVITKAIEGNLNSADVVISKDYATCVVAASGGYPGHYEKGKVIAGLDDVDYSWCQVFHAGTRFRDEDTVTNGGRVLGITCIGATLEESIERAYQITDRLHFEDMYFRKDIGQKGLAHLQK